MRPQRAISSLCRHRPELLSPPKFNYLLQLCSNSKAVAQVKQVHQQMILHGAAEDPFMGTKLVQLYGDTDDLVMVHKLFDRLPDPNVFAWTAILAFYLRHGMYKDCEKAYGQMKFNAVLPDSYVFPKILRACAQVMCLEAGVQVHKDVIVCGSELNLEVSNSLIDMYMKCKDVRGARQVFYEMLERDLLSWNSMISGLVYNGLVEEAVQYFGHMRSDGFEPDTVTLNTTMDAYCRLGLCEEAWKIFAQIKEPNIISWTTLISGYSRMGKHNLSLGIFRDMMYKEMVIPDVDSLSSIIVSCRHLNFPLNGREIHGYGIKTKKGIVFYQSAGPALLTMYAKCGRFQDAVNIFESMDKSDVVTWNAMIVGFVDLGCTNMALEYFSKLQRTGLKNDQTTISTALPVCDLNSGKQIHAYIRKFLFNSVLVWNALINMYCKCGHIGYAYCVFSNMVTRDLVSWNTIIGGFGMHGLGRDALQLLYEMINSGLSPDSVTITSVLSACSHSGLADEGLKIFHSVMKDHSITPRIEHFTCVVDMLARAGRLEEAVNFITRMPSEPNKHIWGALLAASRAHQNVNVGILAAEQLIHLEPENAGHYITLSNIYARAGRWDDAVRMRKKMEDGGLVKPSGQSWIEGGNWCNESKIDNIK